MNQLAYYDPLLFKCPKGAVVKGTRVAFHIFVKADQNISQAYLMIKNDYDNDYQYVPFMSRKIFTGKIEPNQIKEENIEVFEFVYNFDSNGHFWYKFKLETKFGTRFLNKTYTNYSYVSEHGGEDFFQLVTSESYKTPADVLEGGIIYQIMVDRFCKLSKPKVREPLIYRDDWGGAINKYFTDPIKINSQVFGGSFTGATSKLEYIKQLGVTTIYFNPISLANSHHKYDTADYMRVDDMYGTETQFKELVEKARKLGIKVIIDGVYNHTGSDSVYFNREKHFGDGGAYNDKNSKYYDWYEWVNYPNEYNCWWGIDTLPNVRDNCKAFRNYIAGEGGVIEKFMKLGVAGVRLDVADEISDEFLKLISNRVKLNNPNGVVMGEVWEDASTKISYGYRRKYFSNNELNSVMNYPVKESIINYIRSGDPFDFVSTLRMLQNNYPKEVQDNLMNFLGTHDTGRIMSELLGIAGSDRAKAKKLLKIAVGLTFTVTGVPSIFYGDEYGMENNDGNARGCFDWNNSGSDILNMFKKFAQIRQLEVFKHGEMNILSSENGKLVFERIGAGERVIVFTNMKESALRVNLSGNYVSLLNGKKYNQKNNNFCLNYLDIEILQEIIK